MNLLQLSKLGGKSAAAPAGVSGVWGIHSAALSGFSALCSNGMVPIITGISTFPFGLQPNETSNTILYEIFIMRWIREVGGTGGITRIPSIKRFVKHRTCSSW